MHRMRIVPTPEMSGRPENTLDLNQTNISLVYYVGDAEVASVQFETDETTAQVTLYRSNDQHRVFAFNDTITLGPGRDISDTIDCAGFKFLHVVVTTLAGAAAQGRFTVVGKA